MADKYQQEGNTDAYQTEDGTGVYILEIQPPGGYRSPLAFWLGGASMVPETPPGPPPASLALLGVGR